MYTSDIEDALDKSLTDFSNSGSEYIISSPNASDTEPEDGSNENNNHDFEVG